MYVSWGKHSRYKFVSGGELRAWSPPLVPAVFAITYKQDPATKPNSHTVLYFGHAENLSDEMPAVNEEINDLWNKTAGNADKLYVFVYPMPGSTQGQRANIHWQLVTEYSPAGNF